jgi:hypothetical protein
MQSRKPTTKLFYLAASAYAAWFVWLLYVAMINVQAGNQ